MSLARFFTMRESKCSLWIKDHFDYPHQEWCLIWPFSAKGAGYPEVSGMRLLVTRIMCEYRNGPPPTPEHHAAHSCDRGHDKCVNPNHLSWKTPTENQLDRFRDGPATFARAKLTPQDAATIRGLKGIELPHLTAKRFGVSESNVRLIQYGKTWREGTRRPFTQEEILRIRSTPQADGVTKAFAAEFGVHIGTIQRIRSGKFYSHIESADPRPSCAPAVRETP